MATAQVRALHEQHGVPVAVFGATGRRMWHEVFEGNPRLLPKAQRIGAQPCSTLVSGDGERAYIKRKRTDRWTWQTWDIAPGELYLKASEVAWATKQIDRVFEAADFGPMPVLIEPNTKATNQGNKAWVPPRWQALVDRYPPGTFVQVGKPGACRLDGVPLIETPTFRAACAVLACCEAFVGTEGGLHHAAAALGVPAVVLFAEFISPEVTGYAAHRNIWHGGEGLGCGMRYACEGCRASMRAITVDEVERNLSEVLDDGGYGGGAGEVAAPIADRCGV